MKYVHSVLSEHNTCFVRLYWPKRNVMQTVVINKDYVCFASAFKSRKENIPITSQREACTVIALFVVEAIEEGLYY